MSVSPQITDRLLRLRNTVQQLALQLKQLQQENRKLQQQAEKLQSELDSRTGLIKELQLQADVLKMGVQHWNQTEKKLLEKKIDVYLKEIEKCMALINS